ncbi:basal body protein 10-like [Oryza sativa Japonica Group]|uniref:Os12g0505366 protein n=1 Tax=Oryza sativa subsp. japonica TaxID=39947 RepID=Q2QQ65_ORYSJ|nr:hypothetical protein LOC_Os12g32080 [Oryza sativa Japonica Group]BAT17285.1 Os12g0505366 [Oryza sativa Japonica Group]
MGRDSTTAASAAAGVEPAALAYIRHLVEELEDTAFEDACSDQADEFNDGDLFHRRPEPSEVPAAVARALDGVEDLLWKGSPTLAAYARQDARNRRLEQQNVVAATAAAVADTGAAVDAHRRAIAAKLPRLRALRARLAALTTTASAAAGSAEEVTGAVVSVLERMNRAQEEEAAAAAAVDGLRASLAGLLERLVLAVEEAEEEEAKLEAMGPELPGLAEDVGVLFRAQKRFLDCLRVLRQFVASAR